MTIREAHKIKIGDHVISKISGKKYLVFDRIKQEKSVIFRCYSMKLNVYEFLHTEVKSVN